MSLNYKLEKDGSLISVNLSGVVNEDAEIELLKLLDELLIHKRCILSLKEIHQLNTLGVRAWIHFIRELETGRTVTFKECSPHIVNQMNMTPSFYSKSLIRSLYARYICEDCFYQKLHLYEVDSDFLGKLKSSDLDKVKCPNCGENMVMEEEEDEYFSCILRP